MSDLTDILHQLQSHSVPPAAGQFENILKKIKDDKNIDGIEELLALRDASHTPPEFLLENILSVINEETSVPVRRLPRFYITRIAAAVLALAGVWGIYKMASNNNDAVSNQNLPVVAEVKKDVKANISNKSLAAKHTHKKDSLTEKTIPVATYTAVLDGSDFAVTNNDILYSFASLNTTDLPEFITNEETEAVEMKIDQSTSITVSEGMVSMMKTMYKTKRNGKPTARARKTKKRIERWKNSDEKFFDKNPGKNPMDPVDLAEFIF